MVPADSGRFGRASEGRWGLRKYANKPMADLAAELAAGLARLKKGYVDAAEALLQIIQDDQQYPTDLVIYRLTGYRPARSGSPGQPMAGRSLGDDLMQLILDVSDSFELQASDYAEPCEDVESLARRFNVSTKTLQRWRACGLVARRLVYSDGKRRLAFLESSIRRFLAAHGGQVGRSMKFSQMTAHERRDILRRARRMSSFAACSLSEVSRRLARRTGRAVETVRYTIRKHDQEHPDEAIFPDMPPALKDPDKAAIYRGFLRGTPMPSLGSQFRRTRGSIYRIVGQMRAQQLLQRPIPCMYNPQFDLPNADEIMLSPIGQGAGGAGTALQTPKAASEMPPYLRSLYEVPLLSPQRERDLFRCYNYLKYKADRLRRRIDPKAARASQFKAVETMLLQANGVKNQIIRANLRLVVSIAKKHVGAGPQNLFELVSDGNVTLMRAVEKFDYSRGNRFSTYASWAIMRSFARSVSRERHHLDRFATGHDDLLDLAGAMRAYDADQVSALELRDSIDAMLAQLAPRERKILIDHYGLDQSGQPKTLDQLGQDLGLSKERVRQIEMQVLAKLRRVMRTEQTGSPA